MKWKTVEVGLIIIWSRFNYNLWIIFGKVIKKVWLEIFIENVENMAK